MNKKALIGVSVVGIIVLIVIANITQGSGPAFSVGKTIEVKAKAVEKGEISSVVSASGVIEAIEKADIYYDEPMRVKEIFVNKNQEIIKGQKLAEFDLSFLNNEISQLKINKQIEELNITKLKEMDNTRGTSDLKVALDLADLSIRNAQKTLDEAMRDYETGKKLFEANIISRSEFERNESLKREAELGLKNAQQNKEATKVNLAETQKSNSQSISSKKIELKMSEKNLEAIKLKISDLENKLNTIVENTMSPIDGIITEINIEKGVYTNASMPGFGIVNPNKLRIRADVKEFYVKDIAVGQNVSIFGDAIGSEDNVTGVIESISPIAKKKLGSSGEETLVEVIIAIQKSNPVLKPGLTVSGKITTEFKNDAVIVSFDMLKEDENGNKQVVVVDDKNIMHETDIKLGITSELDAEVVEGLNEGDMVVIYPKANHTDGTTAIIIKDK